MLRTTSISIVDIALIAIVSALVPWALPNPLKVPVYTVVVRVNLSAMCPMMMCAMQVLHRPGMAHALLVEGMINRTALRVLQHVSLSLLYREASVLLAVQLARRNAVSQAQSAWRAQYLILREASAFRVVVTSNLLATLLRPNAKLDLAWN